MSIEYTSFENRGFKFVSASESGRNRARAHYFPAQSAMTHSGYKSVAEATVKSPVHKRIFIMTEEFCRVVDSKELIDISDMPKDKRNVELTVLAAEMYSADEVIIEDTNPEEIRILNLPQVIYEPIGTAVFENDAA